MKVKGRPQAVVLNRQRAGDVVGEISLMRDANSNAAVVVDSARATVLKLPKAILDDVFRSQPLLACKVYAFLATRQAQRFWKVTTDEATSEGMELVTTGYAPKDIRSLCASPAFLLILNKFVLASPYVETLAAAMELISFLPTIHAESDEQQLLALVQHVSQRHLSDNAERPLRNLPRDLLVSLIEQVVLHAVT